jgi:KaiC/GvpD/RAD55 family RecA-like ATPase
MSLANAPKPAKPIRPQVAAQSAVASVPSRLSQLLKTLCQLKRSWGEQDFAGNSADVHYYVERQISEIIQLGESWNGDASQLKNGIAQLRAWLGNNASDAVLRYRVARFVALPDAANYYRSAAEAAYRKHYPYYNQAFGKFLPADLQKIGHEQAVRDYSSDSFAAASDDWSVYGPYLLHPPEGASDFVGISTGLSQVDEAVGGLPGVTFLAGEAGVGKTMLAIATSVAALKADPDLCVLFYSIDMPKERIYSRLVCHQSEITFRELLSRDSEVWVQDRIREASDYLETEILPRMKVRHRCHFTHPEDDFASIVARDLKALADRTRAARALVVIDSFRRIPFIPEADNSKDPDLIRLADVERINADAVLVVAEIRKADRTRTELILDDLRGSSSLGYSPDNVLMLWNTGNQHDAETVPVMLRIAKGRDGVIRRDIPLLFDHAHYRFCEVQPAAKPARNGAKGKAADPLAGHRGKRKSK